MTKRNLIILVLLIGAIALAYLLKVNKPDSESVRINPSEQPVDFNQDPTPQSEKPLPPLPVKNGRKVLGLPPSENQEEALKELTLLNEVSPHWEEKLETSLKLQGGEDLKEVKIQKVESLIMKQSGGAINTESVVVSLTNERGEVSKFRAMVDSGTGKIIETWDRPISDPMNPREEFKLKVDPRYNVEGN